MVTPLLMFNISFLHIWYNFFPPTWNEYPLWIYIGWGFTQRLRIAPPPFPKYKKRSSKFHHIFFHFFIDFSDMRRSTSKLQILPVYARCLYLNTFHSTPSASAQRKGKFDCSKVRFLIFVAAFSVLVLGSLWLVFDFIHVGFKLKSRVSIKKMFFVLHL